MKIIYICFASILLFLSISCYADRALKRIDISVENSDKRIALIIGNGDYTNAFLKNPTNDAEDVSIELTKYGFTVTKLVNATQSQMRKAIRQFGRDLKKSDVGLFYYSGHGMQVNGVNYLIPLGSDIQEEDEVQDFSVDAGMILRKMDSAGNRLNMVFLDACRNNPFARSFRNSQKGLAQMDAPSGSMISYATAPGKVAADGTGRNGTFTKNFLLQLRNSKNIELGQLMKKVGKGTQLETGKKQVPWVASSITGDFYFSESNNLEIPKNNIPHRSINKWALLIGINKYENFPSGTHLRGSEIDVDNLKHIIVNKYGFKQKNIITLKSEEATYNAIKYSLIELYDKTGKEDLILIYFAGHGINLNNHYKGKVGNAFLTYDFWDTKFKDSNTEVISSKIFQKWILRLSGIDSTGLKNKKTRTIVVIVDSISSMLEKNIDNVVYITPSCSIEQPFGKKQVYRGLFTKKLLAGLNGNADLDDNNSITYSEIMKYMRFSYSDYWKGGYLRRTMCDVKDIIPIYKGTQKMLTNSVFETIK